MSELRLLDLCCCAGGCSVGYSRAAKKLGIKLSIVGVDMYDQPNYPFEFIKADAMEFLDKNGRSFTHIHASPPCQAYSASINGNRVKKDYQSILPELRDLMYRSGLPGVIENVVGSPLRKDIELSGNMFGLGVIRHRIFETVNWFELWPQRTRVKNGIASGRYIVVAGEPSREKGTGEHIQGRTLEEKRRYAMGIHWMTKKELRQAIPPNYTEYIGQRFLKQNT